MTVSVPKVAPAARRMAEEAGVDLATLEGSGPGGRIVRADVMRALREAGATALCAATRRPMS